MTMRAEKADSQSLPMIKGPPETRNGSGQPPRFTSRPLMQPFGYESNPLSNRRHVTVPTIPDGLPDLVHHVGHLRARADAPIPAMSDRLTGLGRHFEARSVPVPQELFTLGRTRMLRKCQC